MLSCLRKKIPCLGTALVILALLLGLSLIACSQPDDPVSNPVNAAQPIITVQPQSDTWDVGADNTFQLTVTAGKSDSGTLSYQWYSNTNNNTTGGTAIGTDSSTFTLNKTDYTANGDYYFYVVVTNTNNAAAGNKTASVTSEVATVTVSGNGTNPPGFTLPEGLKGTWVSVYFDNEEYIISGTEFFANDAIYGTTYAGTIVNHREAGSGAGYITIQYTVSYYGNGVGKFYVIHYKNLTSSTVSISGAGKFDDPDFGINDTGGKATQAAAEAAYTVAGGYFSVYSDCVRKGGSADVPIPLVENEWANGKLTNRDSVDVYTIAVTEGTTYYLWWNDSSDGPDPKNKTGDVDVRVDYSNGDTILAWLDHGWTYSRPFTAARNDTVYVSVRPHGGSEDDSYLGTYGIVFSTGDTRPEIAEIPPDDPVPLSAGVWEDGRLTKTDGVDVYTIDVTGGVSYYVWWNDAFDGPHPKNKIGDVDVRAIYDNGGETIFTWTGDGWTDPQSFTAAHTGTVYVEVRPDGTSIGEYGIAFDTVSIRPGTDVSNFALVDGVWANNTLADKDSLHVNSFAVTGGTTYNIWWNDKKAGDGTKIADVQVQARYGDDSLIFGTLSNQWVDSGWDAPQSFTAARTGTVNVRVRPYNGEIDKPGAYGMVFSTGSTRPGSSSIDYANAVTLINDQWEDGNLPNPNSIDVYKFDVSGGQTYRLWWDQSGSNGGGSKTGRIQVRAEYGDKSAIFGWQDNGWTSSNNAITANGNGIVYVIVRPYNENALYTGSYGIVYSTGATIPIRDNVTFSSVSAVAGTPTAALTLTFDKAIPGLSSADITLSGIPGMTKGTLSGSGPVYTLPISGFPLSGTLTVAVAKTLYNISGSSKTVTVTGTGVTPIPLIENQWANGSLPNASDVHWYSIAVTQDTIYNVWWNDRGQGNGDKDADLDVIAYYSDGSAIGGWATPADDGWDNPKSFTATNTGTVYVRVRPFNNSASFIGSYGIVFSTGNTRPAQ
jgi:hypothetical protein